MTTNKKGVPLEMVGRPGTPSKHRDQNTTNAKDFQFKDLPAPTKKKRTATEEEDLVYDYLLTHGSITPLEADTLLDVWNHARRIKALRDRGVKIDTIFGYIYSESGSRYHHTKQYILRPEATISTW